MNVTLITGATSGIGKALVQQFAGKKHNLLLVARNEENLKELCSEIRIKNGIAADYIAADLSKPDGANLVFEESKRKKLMVNVLVNNAGAGSSGEFLKNSLKSELELLQLNNASMVALCRLFLPAMAAGNRGSIINLGSMASFFPSPYMAVYAASKAFVRSFTEALTAECTFYGVHVLFFAPGLTTTNFMKTAANDNAWGKTLTESANTQTPEQVAEELMGALEKKKAFHVSGRMNALAVMIMNMIPNSTIARLFARSTRKKMKL